jgi:hypothetical protein
MLELVQIISLTNYPNFLAKTRNLPKIDLILLSLSGELLKKMNFHCNLKKSLFLRIKGTEAQIMASCYGFTKTMRNLAALAPAPPHCRKYTKI